MVIAIALAIVILVMWVAMVFDDDTDTGNDEYYAEIVNMDIGVLIREGNIGSVRWKYSAEVLPFSTFGSKEC